MLSAVTGAFPARRLSPSGPAIRNRSQVKRVAAWSSPASRQRMIWPNWLRARGLAADGAGDLHRRRCGDAAVARVVHHGPLAVGLLRDAHNGDAMRVDRLQHRVLWAGC
jgi:hypothetical protein